MDEHIATNLLPSHTMSKSINFLFIFKQLLAQPHTLVLVSSFLPLYITK